MSRRLTRHDFNRAYVRGCPRHDCPTSDAPAPAAPPLADLLPPPPPPAPRQVVKLDLRNAPSAMESLAESWRAKGG